MKSKKACILVEFNGVAGTGKTTISKSLLSQNKNFLKKYVDYQEYLKYYTNRSRLKKIIWFLGQIYRPLNLKFTFYTLLFILSVGNITKDKLYRGFSLIKTYMHYNNLCKNNKGDIIIIDQGIIQQIISILYLDESKELKQVNKMLVHMKNSLNITFINTNLDVNENINRIGQREYKFSRLDFMDESNAYMAVTIQEKNHDKIRQAISEIKINYLNINTSLDVEHNTRIINEEIGKLV
ncbi:hypothetical protein [Salisediminibacterium selenitireducens]|uniref:Deoxynucleoside kinase domain-containing protein n=1 Tax=Bacillus selenitireducens (strain ATCC 700615 / DSM 15326 / MLS10) TaxID=439292 RepID=D6Y021_BACIE|nr:hypothetical protein [Salisediminibacterium selenitireducens]ADI00523.1 hypothetical protein Bsel_3041 [[Bacillus] selenitireducens MLS10]